MLDNGLRIADMLDLSTRKAFCPTCEAVRFAPKVLSEHQCVCEYCATYMVSESVFRRVYDPKTNPTWVSGQPVFPEIHGENALCIRCGETFRSNKSMPLNRQRCECGGLLTINVLRKPDYSALPQPKELPIVKEDTSLRLSKSRFIQKPPNPLTPLLDIAENRMLKIHEKETQELARTQIIRDAKTEKIQGATFPNPFADERAAGPRVETPQQPTAFDIIHQPVTEKPRFKVTLPIERVPLIPEIYRTEEAVTKPVNVADPSKVRHLKKGKRLENTEEGRIEEQ